MEAKDKAKEMYDKYWFTLFGRGEDRYNRAKKCALICVEGIINYINERNMSSDQEIDNKYNDLDFYNNVRREIEEL